jgi:hypothetical protein
MPRVAGWGPFACPQHSLPEYCDPLASSQLWWNPSHRLLRWNFRCRGIGGTVSSCDHGRAIQERGVSQQGGHRSVMDPCKRVVEGRR